MKYKGFFLCALAVLIACVGCAPAETPKDTPKLKMIPLLYYRQDHGVFGRTNHTYTFEDGQLRATEEYKIGYGDAVPLRAINEAEELYGIDPDVWQLLDYVNYEDYEIYLFAEWKGTGSYCVVANGTVHFVQSETLEFTYTDWNIAGDTIYLHEGAGEYKLAVHSLHLPSGKQNLEEIQFTATDPKVSSLEPYKDMWYCDGMFLYYTETFFPTDDTYTCALSCRSLVDQSTMTYHVDYEELDSFILLEDEIVLIGKDWDSEFMIERISYDFEPLSLEVETPPNGYMVGGYVHARMMALWDDTLCGLLSSEEEQGDRAIFSYDLKNHEWGDINYIEHSGERRLLDYKFMCVNESGDSFQLKPHVRNIIDEPAEPAA